MAAKTTKPAEPTTATTAPADAAANTPATDGAITAQLAAKDEEIAKLELKLAEETARANSNGENLAKRIEEYNRVSDELEQLKQRYDSEEKCCANPNPIAAVASELKTTPDRTNIIVQLVVGSISTTSGGIMALINDGYRNDVIHVASLIADGIIAKLHPIVPLETPGE